MPNVKGHYGPYGATFEECVASVSSWSDNPEGFCNWVHQNAQGGPPGSEERGAKKDAWSPGVNHWARCDRCGQQVPVLQTMFGEHHHTLAPHHNTDGKPCVGGGMKWHRANEAKKHERPHDPPHNDDASKPMRRVNRFDLLGPDALSPPEKLANGWLKVDGRIARVGVLVYQDAGGGSHRELVLPDELFDSESMESFRMVPLTNTHPTQLLDAQTAKRYTVGSVGENLRKDGEWLAAPLMITDAEAVACAELGRSQLSCGYSCELEERPGSWNGEAYDAIQRKRRGNHVALVDIARAGEGAALRLDSGDALLLGSSLNAALNAQHTAERAMPHVIKIDGKTIDVTDANASLIQQLHESALAHERTRIDGLVEQEKKRVAEEKKRADAAEKKLNRLLERIDAKKKDKKAADDEQVTCPECKGKGKVADDDDDDGKMVNCDYCDGKGKVGAAGEFGGEVKDDDDDDDDDMKDDADELEVEQTTESESKKAHKDKKKRDAKAKRDKKRADAMQRRLDSIERMVRRGVKARTALIVEASKHLPADTKFGTMDDATVRKTVVEKLAPHVKLDGKSDEFVAALFESETARVAKLDADKPAAVDKARAAMLLGNGGAGGARTDAAPTDPDEAKRQHDARLRDAWKTPKAS